MVLKIESFALKDTYTCNKCGNKQDLCGDYHDIIINDEEDRIIQYMGTCDKCLHYSANFFTIGKITEIDN